jgi:hypothetical protein
MEAICSSKTSALSELHGVTFQQTILFIATVVRSANSTQHPVLQINLTIPAY